MYVGILSFDKHTEAPQFMDGFARSLHLTAHLLLDPTRTLNIPHPSLPSNKDQVQLDRLVAFIRRWLNFIAVRILSLTGVTVPDMKTLHSHILRAAYITMGVVVILPKEHDGSISAFYSLMSKMNVRPSRFVEQTAKAPMYACLLIALSRTLKAERGAGTPSQAQDILMTIICLGNNLLIYYKDVLACSFFPFLSFSHYGYVMSFC
jgi:hypothetical protein